MVSPARSSSGLREVSLYAGIWKGPWSWFLYEITDPASAMQWFKKGVEYIETMHIGEMIDGLNASLNDGGDL